MRRGRAVGIGAVIALGASAVLPAPASAHGIGGVSDLPIPTWLFAWAAAIVLVASFVALATLWPEPRLERSRQRVVAAVPRMLEPLAGAVGVVLLALVVYAGLAGEQNDPSRNLAPTAVYMYFWVGLPLASFLFGDIFRALNPWRALARAGAWAARRAGLRLPPAREYPRWLGQWPAAAGILAFAWVELCFPSRAVPSTLALLVLGYVVAQFVGMASFGIESWEQRGDPFAVYLGLFAKLSPISWEGGELHLRRPLEGVTRLEVLPGTVALLAVMIGSTSFDGLSQTTAWTELLPGLQRDLSALGGPGALELVNTVGLGLTILVVAGIYRLGILGLHSVGPRLPTAECSRRFAHTLVPIALAYLLAHYFTFLVYQGQSLAYLISDPLGTGANLFGTAHATIDYGVISASHAWYIEVAALLGGHVAALVLAHDRALASYRDEWEAGTARVGPGGVLVLERRISDAIRSQYWMLGVMVAFTCLGLWLLSEAA